MEDAFSASANERLLLLLVGVEDDDLDGISAGGLWAAPYGRQVRAVDGRISSSTGTSSIRVAGVAKPDGVSTITNESSPKESRGVRAAGVPEEDSTGLGAVEASEEDEDEDHKKLRRLDMMMENGRSELKLKCKSKG